MLNSSNIDKILSTLDVKSSKTSNSRNDVAELLKKELSSELLTTQKTITNSRFFGKVDSLLDTILKKSFNKEALLNALKQDIFIKTLNSFSLDLKSLLDTLKTSKNLDNFISKIDSNLLKIETMSSKELEIALKQSGIFMEANLLKELINSKDLNSILFNNPKDLKLTLLQLKQELSIDLSGNSKDMMKVVDKLLTQIEYMQLLSYADNSIYFKLASLWEDIDDGYLKFKSLKKDKFYCEIELKLKEFNRLKLSIMLYDKDIVSISIFTESEKLETILKSAEKELKNIIKSVGLNISRLEFLEFQSSSDYSNISNLNSVSLSIEA